MARRNYEGATQAHVRMAKRLGKRHGASRFDGQYLPGGGRYAERGESATAQAMLRDYNEGGDCEWAIPPAWLSGEWADDPTPQSIAAACGVDAERDPDGIVADHVAEVFTEAADHAWSLALWRQIHAAADAEQREGFAALQHRFAEQEGSLQ